MENNWESSLVITYSHDSTEREMTSKKGTVMFPGRQEGVWRGEMVVSVDREVQEMIGSLLINLYITDLCLTFP